MWQGKLTNDVYTENSVGLLFREELDKALTVLVCLGSGVGSEGEFSDVILNTSGLQVLLGLSHPGNFGVGVDDRRDAVVVDVTVTRFDVFNSGDTFLLSLVCKHGTKGHVTDTLDVLDRSIELRINDNPALVVLLNTNSLKVKTFGVWTTANGDQNNIRFELR